MQSLTLDAPAVPEQISELLDFASHAIAVSYADRQLTYRELDCRADQFAGYLAELGVVSGGTVAICMERSFDWIVAALGIMRAGAAYVPLDSSWPDARLSFAVKDSGAAVLVARQALLDRLPLRTTASRRVWIRPVMLRQLRLLRAWHAGPSRPRAWPT